MLLCLGPAARRTQWPFKAIKKGLRNSEYNVSHADFKNNDALSVQRKIYGSARNYRHFCFEGHTFTAAGELEMSAIVGVFGDTEVNSKR
jgi:hypothetical protein